MAQSTRPWGAAPPEAKPQEELAAVRQRHTAVVGDPTPLGLVAFGTSTFVAGSVLAGWWPRPELQLVAIVPLLIVFGGIGQFAAAMWSFGRGQTVASTFLGTFGAFFATVGVYDLVVARFAAVPLGPALTTLGPLGVAAGCFAFIALFVAAASLYTNWGLSATALALTCSLLLVAWVFFVRGNTVIEAISGWFAVVSGALAFFTAAFMSVAGGSTSLVTMDVRHWRPQS